jgi:hypothetical protein
MITITDNVPIPFLTEAAPVSRKAWDNIKIDNVPMPKRIAAKIDPGLRKIIDRFNEAHVKVYGVAASVTYEKPWLRVSGVDTRVSRQRLLEMAKQLEYRAG